MGRGYWALREGGKPPHPLLMQYHVRLELGWQAGMGYPLPLSSTCYPRQSFQLASWTGHPCGGHAGLHVFRITCQCPYLVPLFIVEAKSPLQVQCMYIDSPLSPIYCIVCGGKFPFACSFAISPSFLVRNPDVQSKSPAFHFNSKRFRIWV